MLGTPLVRQFFSEKLLTVLDGGEVEIDLDDSTGENLMNDLDLLDQIVFNVSDFELCLNMRHEHGRVYLFATRITPSL